jgi:hypothetical protein
MTKLLAIGVAAAVLLLEMAPAFAHYRGYRAHGYYGGYRALGYYGGYRARGYYRSGYRAYGYYGRRPYRYYLPAELHRQYDRNSTAFNS